MKHVRNVWLFILLLASWARSLAVVPEDLPLCAPPPALQQALDGFFNKHKGDFILKEAAGFAEQVKAHRVHGNAESLTKLFHDFLPLMTDRMGKLKETLEKNHCEVIKLDEKTLVFGAPEFPGFLCKMPGTVHAVLYHSEQHNLRRVDSARAIQTAITLHHDSQLLNVPAKYLYHLPWAGLELNDSNYIVVVERIAGNPVPFGPRPAEQGVALLEVAIECGLSDFHSENLLVDGSGRLVFIDTEDFCDWSPAGMDSFYQDHAEEIDRICPDFGHRLKAASPAECADMRPLLKCLHGVVMVKSPLGSLGGAASHDFLTAMEAYASTYFEKHDANARVVQDLARVVVLNRGPGGALQ